MAENLSPGYFPYRYHAGFVDYLANHPEWFEIITYDDLAWQEGDDPHALYPNEKAAWDARLRRGELDGGKIYVLIQHDVDRSPERTMRLLAHEIQRGVPSNLMLFNRRIDRQIYIETGSVRETDYPLDFDLLRLAETHRFVIGYHMNAYERADYDAEMAREFFKEDVAALGRNFRLKYFSAHGGVPGPGARNNRDLDLGIAWADDMGLRWVHNGKTPRFDATFSDGGINSTKLDPESRDLRKFVECMAPGKRYRVLTHPQYYVDAFESAPRLKDTGWYREVCSAYRAMHESDVWSDVVPGSRRAAAPARKKGLLGCLKAYFRSGR